MKAQKLIIERVMIGAVLFGIVVLGLRFLRKQYPIWATKHQVQRVASEQSRNLLDGWGQTIELTVTHNQGTIYYTARSPGADGIFYNADDIAEIKTKPDYAYKIGAWSAEKVKSFVQGATNGVKK